MLLGLGLDRARWTTADALLSVKRRSLPGRDVLQDLEERAGLAHGLPDPGRGEPGPGPLHRRLLQSGPTPLSAGLRQPRPVRKAHQPNRSPLNRGKSKVARVRITPEGLLHEQCQAVEALAHVGVAGG